MKKEGIKITLPRCRMTGKVMYPTLKDARTSLNTTKVERGKEGVKRVYGCQSCGSYHLTSEEEPPSANRKSILRSGDFEKFIEPLGKDD